MGEPAPGPWKMGKQGAPDAYVEDDEMSVAIYASDGRRVAAAEGWPEDALANAHLIAAAPDLLAALEGLVGAGQSFNTETFRDPGKGEVWEIAARRFLDAFAPAVAAIAKAKGEV